MTKFNELKSTIVTLKHAEAELSRIFFFEIKKGNS